jgi:Holliday junction DNA helicase RuvB
MRVIVSNRASEIGILLSSQATSRIAEATRGIPRRARHLLQSLQTVIQDPNKEVTKKMANDHLESLGIDKDNLTDQDRKYLAALARRNAYMSLQNLASMLSLDEHAVTRDIEADLMQMELISVESRGRQLTEKGKDYVAKRGLK